MTKLSARWVPRLLTVDNKRNRMTISKQCFDSFKRNPKMFLLRFVSVDETQIYHYTPEMKEQSKQWIGIEEKTAPLGEKEGALPPRQRACTPIPRCRNEIGGIGLRIAATSTVFSRFSPLGDFLLFPNSGKRFASNEEVIVETEACFAEFDKSYFLEDLEKFFFSKS
jgi:hypothetical protein